MSTFLRIDKRVRFPLFVFW